MRAIGTFKLLAMVGLLASPVFGTETLNGKRFDQGIKRTEKADKAPAALDQASFVLGQYDVAWTLIGADGKKRNLKAQARFDYTNRGWLFSETFQCLDIDGKGAQVHRLNFLIYNPATKLWGLGMADSYRERIGLYHGGFQNDQLVVQDVRRRSGGLTLTYERLTWSATDQGFTINVAISNDGQTWRESEVLAYARRKSEPQFLAGEGIGSAHPERPKAAGEFDFLLGEWEATHNMTLPTGRNVSWVSQATAVNVLGGMGILEHSWFDTDPSLPDAATSIIRLYNRAERRWESLYTTNRGNGLLLFGGSREGDRIVLHPFDTSRDGMMAHWVFYDIAKDTYQWYGESSNDRGLTYRRTWEISFQRK